MFTLFKKNKEKIQGYDRAILITRNLICCFNSYLKENKKTILNNGEMETITELVLAKNNIGRDAVRFNLILSLVIEAVNKAEMDDPMLGTKMRTGDSNFDSKFNSVCRELGFSRLLD